MSITPVRVGGDDQSSWHCHHLCEGEDEGRVRWACGCPFGGTVGRMMAGGVCVHQVKWQAIQAGPGHSGMQVGVGVMHKGECNGGNDDNPVDMAIVRLQSSWYCPHLSSPGPLGSSLTEEAVEGWG